MKTESRISELIVAIAQAMATVIPVITGMILALAKLRARRKVGRRSGHHMKNGTAKSYALRNTQSIVAETLVDVYAKLRLLSPNTVRKDDLARDLKYLMRRSASEGMVFFTTILPILGQYFDDILHGVAGNVPEEFAKTEVTYHLGKAGILSEHQPLFLRPIWIYAGSVLHNQICDSDEPQLSAQQAEFIRLVRSLLLGLKKLEVPTTQGQK